jgi:hypothetical protein
VVNIIADSIIKFINSSSKLGYDMKNRRGASDEENGIGMDDGCSSGYGS